MPSLSIVSERPRASTKIPSSCACRCWCCCCHARRLTLAPPLRYQLVFDTLDVDGSGGIDIHELRPAVLLLGLDDLDEFLFHIFVLVDTDGSGEIEQEEFKTVRALPATVDHTLNAALVR